MATKCPKCGDTKNVCFCGLKRDGRGGYKNSWECASCGHKWTTEIEKEQRKAFDG